MKTTGKKNVLRIEKNALENSCFFSENKFVKPTDYGKATPAIIGDKDPIPVAFMKGLNTKKLRSQFPIPSEANIWLIATYVKSLKGTLFGLIAL